jgi:hypothetical protein
MSSFDGQNTDSQNAKPCPVSVPRDNDLKVSQRGSIQSIANEDYRGQQNLTGSGADVITTESNSKVKY